MKSFRVIFKDGSTVFVQAESVPCIEFYNHSWNDVSSVEEVTSDTNDSVSSEIKLVDTPYTLQRMQSGRLQVKFGRTGSIQDVSDSMLLQSIYRHITKMEEYIEETTK